MRTHAYHMYNTGEIKHIKKWNEDTYLSFKVDSYNVKCGEKLKILFLKISL